MRTNILFMGIAAIAIAIAIEKPIDLQPSQRATVTQHMPYSGRPGHNESWYRDILAKCVSGRTESVCFMGRVDVETKLEVYEVDKLEKHHEALGQAMWYGWATGKKPRMALIVPFGEWRKFLAIKGFVESNSLVRVVAIQAETGNLMAD